MKIDLTCPVEVWRCDKPTADYAAAEITLYNLSDRSVNSVEVTLSKTDRDGRELDRIVHRGHSLRGRPGNSFAMSVPCEYAENVRHIEVIIEKVWFDDNDVWRRGNNPPTEYVSNVLPNCRALEKLHYIAGKNAVGFPQEENDLWLCVCGRPNPKSSGVCVRCHRGRDEIFTRYNREAVEKMYAQKEHRLDLHTRAVREDTVRMQQIREQEYNMRKNSRRRTRSLIALLIAGIVLTCAAAVFIQPALRYLSAVRSIAQNNYAAAVTELEAIHPFLHSDELIGSCRFEQAKLDLNSDDPAVLARAAGIFRAAPENENAPELERMAEYNRACRLLEQGSEEEAAATFAQLGDYKDSAARLNDCTFASAERLFGDQQYAGAEALFRTLGDYPGAAEKADACVYERALCLLEDAGYDEAAALLMSIPDYEDSPAQTNKCYYLKALQLEESGSLIDAGDAYRLAGDYEDAAVRACACLYAPAAEAFSAGDLAAAMALYEKIPGYEDADEQYRLCAYTLASDALKSQEYARALELFSLLPDDYSDTADKKLQAVYKPASAALKKKDWQTAVTLLETIPGYKDSDTLLAKARYGLAGSLVSKGSYADAIVLYEQLGSYSDSEKKLLATRYSEACRLLDSDDAENAIRAFAALGDYSDSSGKLKAARYRYAVQLLENGKTDDARTIFVALGNYGEAAAQIKACDYALANALQQEGKTIEAAELFASLGKYSDASGRAGALYCSLAETAESSGRTLDAAAYYAKAGSYNGAEKKAAAIYHEYYAAPYAAVRDAMKKGNNTAAVTIMDNLVMTNLPAEYADLPDLYRKACYEAGKKLFNEKKPYEALPYFRAVPGYMSADSFLQKPAYMLLGTWTDETGSVLFIFREDGVCWLNGKTLFFNFDNTDKIQTAPAKNGPWATTHRVWNVTNKSLSLQYADTNGKTVTCRLLRAANRDIPDTVSSENFSVTDDED